MSRRNEPRHSRRPPRAPARNPNDNQHSNDAVATPTRRNSAHNTTASITHGSTTPVCDNNCSSNNTKSSSSSVPTTNEEPNRRDQDPSIRSKEKHTPQQPPQRQSEYPSSPDYVSSSSSSSSREHVRDSDLEGECAVVVAVGQSYEATPDNTSHSDNDNKQDESLQGWRVMAKEQSSAESMSVDPSQEQSQEQPQEKEETKTLPPSTHANLNESPWVERAAVVSTVLIANVETSYEGDHDTDSFVGSFSERNDSSSSDSLSLLRHELEPYAFHDDDDDDDNNNRGIIFNTALMPLFFPMSLSHVASFNNNNNNNNSVASLENHDGSEHEAKESSIVCSFHTEMSTFNTLHKTVLQNATASTTDEDRNDNDDNSSSSSSNNTRPSLVHILNSRPESILTTDPEWFQRQSIRLKTGWKGAKIMDETVQAIDRGEKGMIDRQDLAFLFAKACDRLNLPVEEGTIHAAVVSLFEEAGCLVSSTYTESPYRGERIFRMMTKFEFRDLFLRDETRYRIFDSYHDMRERRKVASQSRLLSGQQDDEDIDTTFQVWDHAKTGWKNRRRSLVWLALYIGASTLVFCHKALQLVRTTDSSAVGPFLVLAKASGAVLNLQGALILIPVTRHFNTWIQSIPILRHLAVPTDVANHAHAIIGVSTAIFSLTHILGHVVQIFEVAEVGNVQDLEESVLDLMGMDLASLPSSKAGRWGMMLRLRASWTGILMTVIMVAAYVGIPGRHTKFNRFWYLHQLLILFLILQCVHGTGNLLQHFQSIVWLAVPMTLYLVPRIYREVKSRPVKIVGVVLLRGGKNLIALTVAKPKGWERSLRVGQYAQLNVPSISRFEWHPFTVSSCPADKHVDFHINCVGGWTSKLYDALEELCTEGGLASVDSHLKIRMEGPFGSPVQTFRDHSVVVLIGAGIGVTPMISVLKDLLYNPGGVRHVVFYWTVRSKSSFDWFSHVLQDVYAQRYDSMANNNSNIRSNNSGLVLEVRNFLTSAISDDRDLGSVLFSSAANAIHSASHVDILLGQHSHEPVQIGRPNWKIQLSRVVSICQSLSKSSCGVFLCGPQAMADQVRTACARVTSSQQHGDKQPVHIYFSKETF